MDDPFGMAKNDEENSENAENGKTGFLLDETKRQLDDGSTNAVQIVNDAAENDADSAESDGCDPRNSAEDPDVGANEEIGENRVEGEDTGDASGETDDIQTSSGDSFVLGQLNGFSQEAADIFRSNGNDGCPMDETDQEMTEIDERSRRNRQSDNRTRITIQRGSGTAHLHVSSPISIAASQHTNGVASGAGVIHSDDDQTNSTISTMEANHVNDEEGMGKFTDDLGSSVNDDYSCLTGNPSTLDWLNNQVAVAISSGILSITCKQLRGELHLDKFGSGNRGKCINAYGQWFTPTEFEAFAGRAQCKDWKRSIRFHGRPLLQLIELDILKVHAVSCTCTACWNGDSAGPVRLHDTKRKTSSLQSLGVQQHPGRRTFSQTNSTDVEVDQPLLKQIRLEMQGQNAGNSTPSVNPSTPSARAEKTPNVKAVRPLTILQSSDGSNSALKQASVNLSNATLVRSPGGTLRISNVTTTTSNSQSSSMTNNYQASSQQASTDATPGVSIRPAPPPQSGAATGMSTRQIQIATRDGGQQTLTLLIPPSAGGGGAISGNGNGGNQGATPTKGANRKQTMYLPVGGTGTAGQQGIPLGLTYAPVQLQQVQQQQQQPQQQQSQRQQEGGGVTIISADLNDHWTNLEDFANNLQQQVNSLHSMIYLSRQKADKALQELWYQATAEKDKEIQKLKSALKQNFYSQNEQPEVRRSNQKHCVNCNRVATMTCAMCQSAFYCGEFCVRRDAPEHREKCIPKGVTVEMVNID